MSKANILRLIAVIELTLLFLCDLVFHFNDTLIYTGVLIGLLLIIIGNMMGRRRK